MKKFLVLILGILLTICCSTQKQYISYNNISVDESYYHNVHLNCYDKKDSLSTVSFIDANNNIHTLSGKTIVIENVIIEKNGNTYNYYGYNLY